jgi:hypothetical protein
MDIPRQPFFVSPLPILVSGVDFLGLGAVNERLIAGFFPGISNATRYMRVYSVMAWMAWRFDEQFRMEDNPVPLREVSKRFARFREKIELLFTWGNKGQLTGIVGSQRSFPTDNRTQQLTFARFGNSTVSWLDAALYGPSLKVQNGLGFLMPHRGSTFGPTAIGTELAKALDASLKGSRYYNRLCDIADDTGTLKMAQDFGERWAIVKSTRREREIFASAFAPSRLVEEEGRNVAARRAAVGLIHSALESRGGTGTVADVREAISRRVTSSGGLPADLPHDHARASFTVLQIRQLQRLCHEALLRWVELALLRNPVGLPGRSSAQLARHCAVLAAKELGLSGEQPLSEVMRLVTSKLGRRGSTPLLAGRSILSVDPFAQMRQLTTLHREMNEFNRLPGYALRGLTVAAVQAEMLAGDELFARALSLGNRDRISMTTLIELYQSHKDGSISHFMVMLIESCTIGQHFATAASGLEVDKNKYRFIPSEFGLQPLISPKQLLGLGITADWLATGMSLMADCGLLERTGLEDEYEMPRKQ